MGSRTALGVSSMTWKNEIVNRLIKFVDEFNLLKRIIKTGLLMKDGFSVQNELSKLEKQ